MTVTDREGYYRAAMGILAEEGRGGLRIASLCRRVGVTTGSFHHWFDGWPGFLDFLLSTWEVQETTRLRDVAEQQPDADQRLSLLLDFAVSFPHDAEAAIRSWAHLDPVVAEVQRRVDAARTDEICSALAASGADVETHRRRAELAMAVLIGHQQRHGSRSPELLRSMFEDLLLLRELDGASVRAAR